MIVSHFPAEAPNTLCVKCFCQFNGKRGSSTITDFLVPSKVSICDSVPTGRPLSHLKQK